MSQEHSPDKRGGDAFSLNAASIKSNAPDLRKALPQRFHHFFDMLVEQALREPLTAIERVRRDQAGEPITANQAAKALETTLSHVERTEPDEIRVVLERYENAVTKIAQDGEGDEDDDLEMTAARGELMDVLKRALSAPSTTATFESVLREVLRCSEEGLLIDEHLHNRVEALLPK